MNTCLRWVQIKYPKSIFINYVSFHLLFIVLLISNTFGFRDAYDCAEKFVALAVESENFKHSESKNYIVSSMVILPIRIQTFMGINTLILPS